MLSRSSPKSVFAVPAGRQAAEELQVYRRAMRAAQRRWSKVITAHESQVRKLMMVEEHCRTQLKKRVMKGTRQHLRYLVNTDLMVASQVATPPSVESFVAYGIPARQITGFSVYVMGVLSADPGRMDVPLLTLMADLVSAWTVVAPSRKEAYEKLASLFQSHVRSLRPSTSATRRASMKGRRCRTSSAGRGGAAARSTVSRENAGEIVSSKHQRRVTSAAGKVLQSARRSKSHSSSSSSTSSPKTNASFVEAVTSSTSTAGASRAISSSQTSATQTEQGRRLQGSREGVSALLEDGTASMGEEELMAFRRFATVTLRQMQQALGTLIPNTPPSSNTAASEAKGRRRIHSPTKMTMAEWVPIATEEWRTLTQRQRRCYYSGKT